MSRLLAMIGGRAHGTGASAMVLLAAATPAAACWHRIDTGAVPPGARPAILIRIGDGGRVARLLSWLLLPAARARIERVLGRGGIGTAAVYAIAPDCETPTWVYRLDSPAAAYAQSHLLPGGAKWRAIRGAVRWWTGCDPAVSGLLIVASR
jgi:hypothetical protein